MVFIKVFPHLSNLPFSFVSAVALFLDAVLFWCICSSCFCLSISFITFKVLEDSRVRLSVSPTTLTYFSPVQNLFGVLSIFLIDFRNLLTLPFLPSLPQCLTGRVLRFSFSVFMKIVCLFVVPTLMWISDLLTLVQSDYLKDLQGRL